MKEKTGQRKSTFWFTVLETFYSITYHCSAMPSLLDFLSIYRYQFE